MPYIDAAFLKSPPYNLPSELTDLYVDSQILIWQDVLERVCRQWFESRAATLKLDGTGSDALHFSVPIITCISLKINDDTDALATSEYAVYSNRTGYPDDRRNPRIKLKRSAKRNIFSRTYGSFQFDKGRQNQTVDGTWGYTEPDGSTPEPVKRMLALMVMEKITSPIIDDGSGPLVEPMAPTGLLIEEEVDDHRKRWQPAGGAVKARQGGLAGLFDNPEILRLIAIYKSPIVIATPADWTIGVG